MLEILNDYFITLYKQQQAKPPVDKKPSNLISIKKLKISAMQSPDQINLADFSSHVGNLYKIYFKKRDQAQDWLKIKGYLRATQEQAMKHIVFFKFCFPDYIFSLEE